MEKNNAIVKAMMDIEYYPPSELMAMDIDINEAQKFPFEKIAALGVAFKPLAQLKNFGGSEGKSGLYYVHTNGKQMFKSGGQYIGNLKAADGGVGGGLARMTKVPEMPKVPVDPVMLCMAVALVAIAKKLDAIEKTQKEILDFLELKEKAKLKGNLNALADVLNNYKFNWDNRNYKAHKHILVQDIKREAEQSIILYQERLTKSLGKKSLFNSGREVKARLNKTMTRLTDYQLALYVFSFSSFLEVMLLENFDTKYLNSIAGKVEEYSGDYAALYKKCAEKTERDSQTSLEGYALKGLSKLSSGAGKIVEKIPVISRSQLDENLIKAGGKLQEVDANRTQNTMQILSDSQTDYVSPFIENIHTLNKLYNEPMQLMFDSENIYIAQLATV